jgi:hypothetical protein
MANIDPNYSKWMTDAAKLIVKQMNDGTLLRCGETGSRISKGELSVDDAIARQIVGIMLAHQA